MGTKKITKIFIPIILFVLGLYDDFLYELLPLKDYF